MAALAGDAVGRPHYLPHLALWQPSLLLGSTFLCGLGELDLLGYVVLGWRYWFSVTFRGVVLAALLFMTGLVLQAWA